MTADRIEVPGAAVLRDLGQASPLLWRCSLVFLAAFVGCLILTAFDTRLLNGIDVWIKPAKFFLSLAVHMLTLAWGLSLLPSAWRHGRTAQVIAAYMVLSAVAEMLYIAGRAGLGQASHFNIGTPLSSALYSAMGLGAVGMLAVTALAGFLILRHAPRSLMTRSAGWGFVIAALLTLITAGTLGAQASHWIGGDQTDATGLPLLGWSTTGGDLRISHFLALHTMQALPLAALTGSQRVVITTATALILGTIATYVQALLGLPLLPS